MEQRKRFTIYSAICALICVLLWIPNIALHIESPWWLLIFLFAPAGVILAVVGRNIWLTLLNLLMFFSFLILTALGFDILSLFIEL